MGADYAQWRYPRGCKMKQYLKWLLAGVLVLSVSPAFAQDAHETEAPAQPIAQADETTETAQQAAPKSDDPGDVIANYLSQMAAILEANQDTPAALIEKFDAFIKENEKSMRTASKKFDEKLKSLKSTDAEVYRETVQRKITPELNRVVSLLIDFGSKYPTEAAKLDSMLKVDAKYTYQQ